MQSKIDSKKQQEKNNDYIRFDDYTANQSTLKISVTKRRVTFLLRFIINIH